MSERAVLKRPALSPLRYPGGKGSLYPRLRSIVRANGLTNGTYVEPYAGGAGAALALLITGEVRQVVINDLDPAVYAFWRAVVFKSQEFSMLIREAKLSIEEWQRQKQIYRSSGDGDYLAYGFSTFYLNRTNRSGVLNGGPIGGLDQTGNYKIDARFNRDALTERVRLIGLHKDHIAVECMDGAELIRQYGDLDDTLIYVDPPYFEKAGTLYLSKFADSDHVSLASCLNSLPDRRWVLTYDNVPKAAELYSDRRTEVFSLHYSAHRVMQATELMIFSDSLTVVLVLTNSTVHVGTVTNAYWRRSAPAAYSDPRSKAEAGLSLCCERLYNLRATRPWMRVYFIRRKSVQDIRRNLTFRIIEKSVEAYVFSSRRSSVSRCEQQALYPVTARIVDSLNYSFRRIARFRNNKVNQMIKTAFTCKLDTRRVTNITAIEEASDVIQKYMLNLRFRENKHIAQAQHCLYEIMSTPT